MIFLKYAYVLFYLEFETSRIESCRNAKKIVISLILIEINLKKSQTPEKKKWDYYELYFIMYNLMRVY